MILTLGEINFFLPFWLQFEYCPMLGQHSQYVVGSTQHINTMQCLNLELIFYIIFLNMNSPLFYLALDNQL